MRAFIALDISHAARDALADAIKRLAGQDASQVRWVRPESIHLTLKFLGEVDPSQVGALLEAMGRGAEATAPLHLGLAGVGSFPSTGPGTGSPRVVWMGLKGDLHALGRLQEAVDREVCALGGFAPEGRPFRPHLTLGRVREQASSEERRRLGQMLSEAAPGSEVWWTVQEVSLVQSTLTPSGAIYKVLGYEVLGAGSL